MIYLTAIFVGFTVIFGAYLFWILPKSGRPFISNTLFALLLILLFVGQAHIIGRPKPIEIEFNPLLDEAQILWATWQEGEAIWIWVMLDKPRAYELPWSASAAEQLQDMMSGKQDGAKPMIKGLFDYDDDDPLDHFYEQPQERLPDKTPEERYYE